MNPQRKTRLPKLRQDLQILQTSPAEDGSKRWRLFDPTQNKHFNLSSDTFKLLSLWDSHKYPDAFIKQLHTLKYEITKQDLETFIQFLQSNNLTIIENIQESKKLYAHHKRTNKNLFQWIIHNYLFIRIPLFKPDAWLTDNLALVNIFYSKVWAYFVFLLGFIGITLALRNWDSYLSTFDHFFSADGMLYFILSLVFIKSMHELGHAFTAKKYGCKVPSMGVAFLVLFPVLYTDTTDAWKLRSKDKRLDIVFAGLKVELYIAMLATFLYAFTDDGVLKSIFFTLATTSWITSILLNISPFLRFDGYYALSDWTDSENLQPRSFTMAKWFLRRNILGLREEVPEYLSQKKQNFFIIYAIATWIYRFVLFLGIAFLVYTFAFKVLGIFLFIVEIVWFILLPIYKELHIWWIKRKNVRLNMTNMFSLSILLLLIASLFIPWNSKINLPAVLEIKNHVNLYAEQEAQITALYFKNNDFVVKGKKLIALSSPGLELSISKSKQEIQKIKSQLKMYASSKDIRENIFIYEEDLLRKQKELEGLLERKSKLIIKAPFDGYISFSANYNEGQWINTHNPIASIYNTQTKLTAYAPENRLHDLDISSEAFFIPNISTLDKMQVDIISISDLSLPYLEYPELSSFFDGEIATRDNTNHKFYTENAYYKVDASLKDASQTFKMRIKGTLQVNNTVKRSIAQRFYIRLVSVLIRESGF